MPLTIIAMMAIATIAISIPQVCSTVTTVSNPTYHRNGGAYGWDRLRPKLFTMKLIHALRVQTTQKQQYAGYGFHINIPDASIISVKVNFKANMRQCHKS